MEVSKCKNKPERTSGFLRIERTSYSIKCLQGCALTGFVLIRGGFYEKERSSIVIITVLVMMLAVACSKKKDEGVFRVGRRLSSV